MPYMTHSEIYITPTKNEYEYDIHTKEYSIGCAYLSKDKQVIRLYKDVPLSQYVLIYYEILNELDIIRRS